MSLLRKARSETNSDDHGFAYRSIMMRGMRLLCCYAITFAVLYGQLGPAGPASSQRPLNERQFWVHLRQYFKAAGSRLSATGLDRAIWRANLTRHTGPGAGTVPINVIAEPVAGKIRLAEESGVSPKTLGHDGNSGWSKDGAVTASDADLIETLVHDTAEHFFASQAAHAPTRFLGARFRFDDGKAPNYRGPFYDVYVVSDKTSTGSALSTVRRIYCLNADTFFLDRVQYERPSGSSAPRIETVLTWQRINGQAFPASITHLQNGSPVLTIAVTSVSFVPAVSDSTFQPARP